MVKEDPNPQETEDLYPDNISPEIRLGKLSNLCSYGVTQHVMGGALRQVLIQHFSDSRNLLNSSLRQRIERDGTWTNDETTGIYIEVIHKWNPELTEKRPGIVLKEAEWRWDHTGIGDKLGEDYRSGREFFGGYWQGAHTIFALAKEGWEAQALATEIMKVLLWFRAEIMNQLELQQFLPISLGSVSPLAESTENYVVPVVVGYVVPEAWHIQPDAPRVKRIVWQTSHTLPDY